MKKIEDHIKENREAFDIHEAPAWDLMEYKITGNTKKLKWGIVALCLAAAACLGLFVLLRQTPSGERPVENNILPNSAAIKTPEPHPNSPSTYESTESSVPSPQTETIKISEPHHNRAQGEFTEYRTLIQSLHKSNPELSQKFLDDMENLERTESSIQQKLKNEPDNMYLLQALQYLQLQKSDIVQKQIKIIRNLNAKTHENRI